MQLDELYASLVFDCRPQYYMLDETQYTIWHNIAYKFIKGSYTTIGDYRNYAKKDGLDGTFLIMEKTNEH